MTDESSLFHFVIFLSCIHKQRKKRRKKKLQSTHRELRYLYANKNNQKRKMLKNEKKRQSFFILATRKQNMKKGIKQSRTYHISKKNYSQ